MADNLLDLELDTMSLSQFTRSDTVFRVPYKKMNVSQTSNSRLSSGLCCKDQIRSNNNSALLDATRSPDYSDMPPLKLAWDDDTPPTSLPDILLKQYSWVAQKTEEQIRSHRGDDNNTTCRLCQQHFSTNRRLRVHIPQHLLTTFCPCGEFSYHRDYILRHQRTMGCHVRHLYDVDRHKFSTFFNMIKPFVTDPPRLKRLKQGFPSPRPITHGPCLKQPRIKKSAKLPSPPPAQTIPRPTTLPQSVLQRIEIPNKRSSPLPSLHNYPLSDPGSHLSQSDILSWLGT